MMFLVSACLSFSVVLGRLRFRRGATRAIRKRLTNTFIEISGLDIPVFDPCGYRSAVDQTCLPGSSNRGTRRFCG